MTQQDQDQYKIEWEALVKLYYEARSRGIRDAMEMIHRKVVSLGVTEMPRVRSNANAAPPDWEARARELIEIFDKPD